MHILLLSPVDPPDTTGYPFEQVIQLVLVLLVMIAVIAAAYYITRLIAGGAMRAGRQSSRMQVVDRVMLARERVVVIIELDGRYFMVGVSASSITFLTEVDGAPYGQEAERGGVSFFSALQGKLRAKGTSCANEPSEWDIDQQEKELERIAKRLRTHMSDKENGGDKYEE